MIKNSHILFDTCIINNLSSKESFLLDQNKLLLKEFTNLGNILYVSEFTKYEPSTSNILHSISDIDIFIGSLAFTEQKPYLLTADFADFPRPFFVERDIFPIEFRRPRGNMNCLYYYLLQANI